MNPFIRAATTLRVLALTVAPLRADDEGELRALLSKAIKAHGGAETLS